MFFKPTKPPEHLIPDPGFVQPVGMPYLEFLSVLHRVLAPDWYLEIGTEAGRSLALAKCRAIAVDPDLRLSDYDDVSAPEVHFFQQTSDAFFAGDFLLRNSVRLDFAFLDGMHLFEFLLRDLINCERVAHPDTVLAIHDCIPVNRQMAEREWNKELTRFWTGDVWKILPALREYRPDLSVQVFDCEPTGLLLVGGLKPGNEGLSERYGEIVERYGKLTLDDYGVERFGRDFPFVSSHDGAEAALAGAGREAFGCTAALGGAAR